MYDKFIAIDNVVNTTNKQKSYIKLKNEEYDDCYVKKNIPLKKPNSVIDITKQKLKKINQHQYGSIIYLYLIFFMFIVAVIVPCIFMLLILIKFLAIYIGFIQ